MSYDACQQWDWPLIRRRCTAEALRMLRRQHEAEDVVQAALTRAWRNRASCRTPEAPLAWCLQITRNEALRLLGGERRHPTELLEPEADPVDERGAEEVERVATRLDVAHALGQLTAQDRAMILLRYMHDCSHPEIAQRMRIPEATARVRLHRAHKRLRSLLDDPASGWLGS
jgi:RNA polymerase sigma-70 factor (ECF subfamily)